MKLKKPCNPGEEFKASADEVRTGVATINRLIWSSPPWLVAVLMALLLVGFVVHQAFDMAKHSESRDVSPPK